MSLALNTIVDIGQIVQDFGEFYVQEGQGLKNLHMLPFESFGTRDAFTIVPTNNTELKESNVEVGEILQAYQEDFTAKGSMSFKPVRIPLHQMKIDQYIRPGAVQRSWLAFLTTNKATVEDWPLIRYIFEEYLTKQSMEDMEMKAIYKGVRVEPEEGVASPAESVMDGIEKQFANFIAAGDLTPITTGTIASSAVDFVTQVEAFIKSIEEKYRFMPMELNMNRTLVQKFKEGMRTKYNMNYQQVSDRTSVVDFDNITIVGRAGMQGKSRLWCTPKFNAIMGVKGFENINAYKLEPVDRKLKAWTDWFAGIGFVQPKLLFVNEQA